MTKKTQYRNDYNDFIKLFSIKYFFDSRPYKFPQLRIAQKLLMFFLSVSVSVAQQSTGDNGNGTFTNPVINADFPDPDVIRVGDTYYMVSTTMFIFPGVTILKSKDLVNWEYCSHAVPRFDFSDCYDLKSCDRYSRGQWASSLRYYNGKFHLLFVTLDEGGFYLTANEVEGPWEINKLSKAFYDPGLFFDEDGKKYVVHGYSEIFMTEVDENLAPISKDSLIFEGNIRRGLEGMHVYKIKDYYYLYGTYGGLDGFQVTLRSKNIWGPYEQKIAIRDTTHGPNYGIHQGALIQTQTGEWWTMLFVDSGPFGRFPSLQPVNWVDDWPIVGVEGKAVATFKKPDVGMKHPVKILPTSDEFETDTLNMQWGWNHNPEPSKWSLKERVGYLRLYTVNKTDSFRMARNTLTQRMFAYFSDSTYTVGTTKMEFSNMKEGDIAGLAIFQDPYAYIGIKRENGANYIVMVSNGKEVERIKTDATTVYLSATPFFGSGAAPLYGGDFVEKTGTAVFYYSFDNVTFKPLGEVMEMAFNLSVFTGNKFCLFNYASETKGGYVDFDWFRMHPENNLREKSYLME